MSCDMKSMSGGPIPRTREGAWAQLEKTMAPRMLEFARRAYVLEQWPWNLENWPQETAIVTENEIRGAITALIAENGGKHIGERLLWPAVQAKFPGRAIPRKAVRALMPARPCKAPRAQKLRHGAFDGAFF